jgi:hypothetical protein
MSIAGLHRRRVLGHYSHIRMADKRVALGIGSKTKVCTRMCTKWRKGKTSRSLTD